MSLTNSSKYQTGFAPITIVIAVVAVVALAGAFYLGKSANNLTVKLPNPTSTLQGSPSTSSWTPTSSHPWPMFHGNYNHSGYAAVSGPKKGNLKWKFLVGKVTGRWPNSVAVSKDGVIYVAGGDKLTTVSSDGKEVWSKSYPQSQGPALSEDGSTIYFVANDSIIAVDSSGQEKWRYKTSGNTIFGPTIGSDGTIYQGSWDHNFYAIKPDGTLKWKYQTNGAISYPSSINQDGLIILGGGDAHAGPDSNVYTFDLNGNLKWKYDTKMLRVGSPAIGSDGLIYLPASPDLFVLDKDGNLKWKKGPNVSAGGSNSQQSSSSSQGGNSQQGSSGSNSQQGSNNQVYGISTMAEALGPPPGQSSKTDVTTGGSSSGSSGSNSSSTGSSNGGSSSQAGTGGSSSNSSNSQGDSNQSSNSQGQGSTDKGDISGITTPGVSPDGTICTNTSQGTIYEIDAKSQEVKWSYKTADSSSQDSGLPSFVIIDKDDTCYVGSTNHTIYAIDKAGKLKWSYKADGGITEAAPAMGANGTLYFTSQDGYLYAIAD